LRLLRPKQWIKNAFVLAPLVFSFKLTDSDALLSGLVAAAIFCLVASAIYVLNDMMDVESDRQHPKKRHRPLASGHVSKTTAIVAATGLLALTIFLLIALNFSTLFLIFLGIYIASNLTYSLGGKHVSLLELFIVASGYVIRLLAGCAAIHETASPWILAATGAVALLIVTGKRRAEIAENHDPEQKRRSLRSYNLAYLDGVITMLAGVTIMTYLLFAMSDYAMQRYHSPYFVGTSVFVLYGVMRYMQLIKVMSGADDPTSLVVTDKSLMITVALWLATCSILIYVH
jgi:4-hydroxybenzoate polyprenyltransferase